MKKQFTEEQIIGFLGEAEAGSCSSTHLATIYFELLAKVQFTHVPYKGTGPVLLDLISGKVSIMIPGVATVIPHLNSGRLKILAVFSEMKKAEIDRWRPVIKASGAQP